jgi:hypothetical protein
MSTEGHVNLIELLLIGRVLKDNVFFEDAVKLFNLWS